MSFCSNGSNEKADLFNMVDPSEWLKRLTLDVANKQRAEMEQAVRNILHASGDTGKKDHEGNTPFNIGFGAELQNEPVKISQGRDVKRGTVAPPPGLGDPMKIRCSNFAVQEGVHLQWNKPASKHVTVSGAPSTTTNPTPRFCTQCGEKVPPALAKARFCTSCGNEHPIMDALHHQAGHKQTTRMQMGNLYVQ
jgi:hypothetical protein